MEHWHKVTVYRGHIGAGRNECVTAYIYAENAGKVFERYKTMPGVKRNPRGGNFPNIFRLSQDESMELEKRIIDEGRILLNEAKRTWYYSEFI